MNDLSSKSGSTRPGMVRLMRVFGVLALVAAGVLLFHHFRKPSPSPRIPGDGVNPPAGNAVVSSNNSQQEITKNTSQQESSLDRLIRILNDTSLSLEERQKAILALARDGSKEAVAALKDALGHSSKEIRLAITSALGECHNPDAVEILKQLLNDPDGAIARAAIASLARQDQAGAATALSDFLANPNANNDLRCTAALALGDSKQPWVLEPLSRIAWQNPNADLTKAALDAIAKLDYSDSKSFFQQYLTSSDVPPEMRLDAISALAQIQGDPTALLMQLAQDSNPDVRAAAAIALSATEASGNYGAALVSDLQNETDPNVRARLYQALENQGSYDTSAVLALLQNEKDPLSQVAGLDLLSRAARDNPNDPALQNFFAQTGIAELKDIALNSKILDIRQEAIIALTSLTIGGNKQAMEALNDVRTQLPQQQAQNSPTPAGANPVHNNYNPQQRAP